VRGPPVVVKGATRPEIAEGSLQEGGGKKGPFITRKVVFVIVLWSSIGGIVACEKGGKGGAIHRRAGRRSLCSKKKEIT